MLNKLKLTWYSSYKVNAIRNKIASMMKSTQDTRLIFIFGCQRSGTTIVQKIIALNPGVKIYGEGDKPYFFQAGAKDKNRLIKDKDVLNELKLEPHNQIILKPLYDSQRAEKLIDEFEKSKGVLVFRNYKDVINSHLQFYKQNAKDYLRPLFISDNSSWLNEVITKDVKAIIDNYDIDELSASDLYALFWLVRNSLYFQVEHNSNVFLLNYDQLLENPSSILMGMCKFVDLPFHDFYSSSIRVGSGAKKLNIKLLPEIELECEHLYKKLLQFVELN